MDACGRKCGLLHPRSRKFHQHHRSQARSPDASFTKATSFPVAYVISLGGLGRTGVRRITINCLFYLFASTPGDLGRTVESDV